MIGYDSNMMIDESQKSASLQNGEKDFGKVIQNYFSCQIFYPHNCNIDSF